MESRSYDKLFNKDFTIVVAGQIISLFGNSIICYALPLYLLNKSHSPALYGAVTACALIPMLIFAPIGGIVADRVNKKNILVALDFGMAGLMAVYDVLIGKVDLVTSMILVLMILYGIQGAYRPAVQASIPVLQKDENLNSANAVINMVNNLAGMIGPVIGGVIYAAFGIFPILDVSIACFFAAAVMEIFIHIPFVKRDRTIGVFAMAKEDLAEGVHFIVKVNPSVGQIGLVCGGINMVLSAFIGVGLPVIFTEYLDFKQSTGNMLLGYADGVMALGGLVGGLTAGIIGKKLHVEKSHWFIFFSTLMLLPMAAAVKYDANPWISYFAIVIPCFFMTIFASLYNVEMMSYYQRSTPAELLGKVMAFLTCLSMCASPIGQAIYGVLFQAFSDKIYLIILGAMFISMLLSYFSKRAIGRIGKTEKIPQ